MVWLDYYFIIRCTVYLFIEFRPSLIDIVHGRMERQDTVARVSVAGSLAKWAASLNVQNSKRAAAKRAGSTAQAIRIV